MAIDTAIHPSIACATLAMQFNYSFIVRFSMYLIVFVNFLLLLECQAHREQRVMTGDRQANDGLGAAAQLHEKNKND